jgi:glycosyltransferase involved in cell wall biosynthesis
MSEFTDMSICLVGINLAPETTGIAPYTTAMAHTLAQAGASVHVVTGIPHYPQWTISDARYRSGRIWREELDGIRVTRCRHHVPAQPDLIGRARLEGSFLARARGVVRADRSDIVIAVTPSLSGLAAAVSGRRGRPLGALVQDLTGNAAGQSGTTSGRVGQTIGRAEYSLLRQCDQVGVITPRFADVIAENGVDAARIVDLPNFTHIAPVSASIAQARRRLGWAEDRFTVIHTGNMGRKQGLESVVGAASAAHHRGLPIDFVLVGDGNQRQELELAARGNPNLRFVDPLDTDDYPYALAAADVLLLNERSGVREMSLPSKLTSYSVAGRPIVAAVEPGGITHEVLSVDRSAHFVDPGDPGALLDAVDQLRLSEPLRTEFAAKAKQLHEDRYGKVAAEARYRDFARRLLHAPAMSAIAC